jgi:hypothetical protein
LEAKFKRFSCNINKMIWPDPIDQPEKDGPTKGSSIPPAPVYSSRFLMVEEDISFATSLHWHSGHWGGGSLENSRSTSKQCEQSLHSYS